MNAKHSLCRPAKAGTIAGAVAGLAGLVLVSFVPAFRDGVPIAITAVIPLTLAWAGHAAAAWLAGSSSHSQEPVPAAAALPAPGVPVSPRPGTGSIQAVRIIPGGPPGTFRETSGGAGGGGESAEYPAAWPASGGPG
jgi:hypothetical protein